MDDKAIRRTTRELADQAYGVELRRALTPLAAAFERWKVGAATIVEIPDPIHGFRQGPSRQLRGTYTALEPSTLVARAVSLGVIARKSLPPEVAASLAHEIETFEQLARDEPWVPAAHDRRLRPPGEEGEMAIPGGTDLGMRVRARCVYGSATAMADVRRGGPADTYGNPTSHGSRSGATGAASPCDLGHGSRLHPARRGNTLWARASLAGRTRGTR